MEQGHPEALAISEVRQFSISEWRGGGGKGENLWSLTERCVQSLGWAGGLRLCVVSESLHDAMRLR